MTGVVPPPGGLVAAAVNRAQAGEPVDTTEAREALTFWSRRIRDDVEADRRRPHDALLLLVGFDRMSVALDAIDRGDAELAVEVFMRGGAEYEAARPASVRDNGDGTLTGTSLIETSRGPVEFRTTYRAEESGIN